jgi:hypothetical protein
MIQLQRTIKMKKADVIKALKKNKDNHIKEYDKAVDGFKVKAQKLLQTEMKKINKGSLSLYVTLAKPISREDYFTNIIGMFTADVNQELELSMSEYNEYVLDQGNAAITASASNSMYFSSGSASARSAKRLK